MQEIDKKSLVSYGKGPYQCYRIPGIVVTARGTILCYFETRLGRSDWSTRGVGLLRSEDNGQTWSEMAVIVRTEQEEAINNPVMIAGKDGRVHFLWQIEYSRGFYQYSDDDGKTFSEAVEITSFLEAFRTKQGYQWKVIAFGPGHGIELANKALLVPVWLANGVEKAHHPSVVSTIMSYDGGKTWETGEIISDVNGMMNPNETCAVQLSDESIMLNIRHMGRTHYRAISISKNGLEGFSEPQYHYSLPDPICFGSMVKADLSINDTRQSGMLFSNCATNPNPDNFYSRERKFLTLRLSFDECKTFQYSRLLETRSGYSDVAPSLDGKWIFCFYEHDVDPEMYSEPKHLTFARVNLEWLME